MIIREMFDTRVKICKICSGKVERMMVTEGDYKGHLFYCVDCGTTYKIVGEGQSDNELEVEYERLYECDPDKNLSCTGRHIKDWCGKKPDGCWRTHKKEFAKEEK